MGTAVWLSRASAITRGARGIRRLRGPAALLNAPWAPLFFGARNLAGLFDSVALWLAIVWTLREFFAVRAPAAWLLVPYFVWVSYRDGAESQPLAPESMTSIHPWNRSGLRSAICSPTRGILGHDHRRRGRAQPLAGPRADPLARGSDCDPYGLFVFCGTSTTAKSGRRDISPWAASPNATRSPCGGCAQIGARRSDPHRRPKF